MSIKTQVFASVYKLDLEADYAGDKTKVISLDLNIHGLDERGYSLGLITTWATFLDLDETQDLIDKLQKTLDKVTAEQ